MRVLITGASGFVGPAIVRQCEDAGFRVRTTGREDSPPTPFSDYRCVDMRDESALPALLEGQECVVHAAGLAHQFDTKQQAAAPFMLVNVEFTERMAKAAVTAGIRHFVLISSVSVYGAHTAGACAEDRPCAPEGPYAESKYMAEQRSAELCRGSGTRLTILRLATVYGEGDPGNVARLMRSIDRGRFVWIGSGTNQKSLIHRDDVARACVAVLNSAGTGVDTFNVCAPPCAMRDVVEGLAAALQRRLPHRYVPGSLALGLARAAGIVSGGRGRFATLHATLQKWLADDVYAGEKLERMCGFKAQVALRDGLQREVDWYRGQTKE